MPATDFWKGRRVLVTGCSGFVGAHLCKRLFDLGADVAGLDLAVESPCLRVLGVSIPILKRDVVDGDLAFALLHGNGDEEVYVGPDGLLHGRPAWRRPEIIFHLAGMSHIDACQKDPGRAWDSHVRGTYRLLEACRALPAGHLKAVVLAGSNHQYGSLGDPDHATVEGVFQAARGYFDEGDAPMPRDVYGAAKACVGLIGRAYGKSLGVPAVTLHHVNAYGPADPHASHIVTATVLSVLRGERPMIRSDGSPRKGYLHIDDVISAYLRLAEAAADHPGEAFNAGPAAPTSVLDLVRAAMIAGETPGEPVVLAEDLSQRGYEEHLSSARLRGLGWQPEIPLMEGLRKTFEWYRDHEGMAWLEA